MERLTYRQALGMVKRAAPQGAPEDEVTMSRRPIAGPNGQKSYQPVYKTTGLPVGGSAAMDPVGITKGDLRQMSSNRADAFDAYRNMHANRSKIKTGVPERIQGSNLAKAPLIGGLVNMGGRALGWARDKFNALPEEYRHNIGARIVNNAWRMQNDPQPDDAHPGFRTPASFEWGGKARWADTGYQDQVPY